MLRSSKKEISMKKHPLPDVSAKNTKEQILAAYNDVVARMSEKTMDVPETIQKADQAKQIVARVEKIAPDNLIAELAELKLKAIKHIESLSGDLMEACQKLSDIKQAIAIEQKNIEELYGIKETANTLATLIKAHHEKAEQFNQESEKQKQTYEKAIADQRNHWKEENDKLEKSYKEEKERLQLLHKREEEDYAYNLELSRRKEQDTFDQKKLIEERQIQAKKEALEAREKAIQSREIELQQLQQQVDSFPETIKQRVEEAEKTLRRMLEEQFTFETRLKEAQQDSNTAINAHRIASLEEKIKEQDKLIQLLGQKADTASEQVQSIASKALEASSKRFTVVNGGVEAK